MSEKEAYKMKQEALSQHHKPCASPNIYPAFQKLKYKKEREKNTF